MTSRIGANHPVLDDFVSISRSESGTQGIMLHNTEGLKKITRKLINTIKPSFIAHLSYNQFLLVLFEVN